MRLHWRLRTMLVGVAALAVVLASAAAVHRRAEHFRRLAAYHLQACDFLLDQAGGPVKCLQVGEGEDWDTELEKRFAVRGDRKYAAYKAAKYHEELFEKYRKAAEGPWLPVAADPRAPAMANPSFALHPDYARMVRDWNKPTVGGFQ
jgi:hypothetical protein